eukprot:scaffold1142_cov387-Prasinococcus_capsulatus_cf.AAC.15
MGLQLPRVALPPGRMVWGLPGQGLEATARATRSLWRLGRERCSEVTCRKFKSPGWASRTALPLWARPLLSVAAGSVRSNASAIWRRSGTAVSSTRELTATARWPRPDPLHVSNPGARLRPLAELAAHSHRAMRLCAP